MKLFGLTFSCYDNSHRILQPEREHRTVEGFSLQTIYCMRTPNYRIMEETQRCEKMWTLNVQGGILAYGVENFKNSNKRIGCTYIGVHIGGN